MRKRSRVISNVGIYCLCVVTLWSCALPAFAQANGGKNERNVLQLRIWTERTSDSYPEKEKIPLHVELVNVGSHGVLIGRDLWTNVSPSRLTVTVIPSDGHAVSGESGAADAPAPNDDLTKAMLNWMILLSPGYSYGSTTALRADLTPGTYKVRAVFTSEGLDSGSFYNPLLKQPEEKEKFAAQNWKGEVSSNELTIRIVARTAKKVSSQPE